MSPENKVKTTINQMNNWITTIPLFLICKNRITPFFNKLKEDKIDNLSNSSIKTPNNVGVYGDS